MLLYLCCLFSVIVGMAQDKKSIPAMSSRQKISVVFIGNSITEATYLQETPPMAATSCLQALGYDVKSINCGISGYNSNDFQPGTKAFQKVTCSATKINQKGSQLIFSIKLGTNDSPSKGTNGSPVEAPVFKRNMQTIIDSLHSMFPLAVFILNYPLWYSENTQNGAVYLKDGLQRLQTYFPIIDQIVRENTEYVFNGDKTGFSMFKKNPSKYYKPQEGKQGTYYLHPNAYGAKVLGLLWAKAIDRVMKSRKMQTWLNRAPVIAEREFSNWPEKASPEFVGKLVSKRFVDVPHPNFNGSPSFPDQITYPEVCTWFGTLRYARVTGNRHLLRQLEVRFLPIFGPERHLQPLPNHVDHAIFGVVPLQLYLQTGNKAYKEMGMWYADEQWTIPCDAKENKSQYNLLLDQNLSWQTRFWSDDMFMITAIQTQAYLVTKDNKYIDRMAHEFVAYLERLQQPNGLFHHAEDVPIYWGRGNGWVAAGFTEMLGQLPADNPDRPEILAAYQRMMKSLLNYQKGEGLWGQIVDDKNSWTETSGSAMFIYAMIKGVKRGWLDAKEFAPRVRKAWIALTGHINENGDIDGVCEGTNRLNDREYYLHRRTLLGDMHGQAPVMWCVTAFLQD